MPRQRTHARGQGQGTRHPSLWTLKSKKPPDPDFDPKDLTLLTQAKKRPEKQLNCENFAILKNQMAHKVASSSRRTHWLVVRRVSNSVNISGVSNDKRMFTRVRTHPVGVSLSFFFLGFWLRRPGFREYFTDIKDLGFAQAIKWIYSSVCLYLMRQFINDGRDLPMGLAGWDDKRSCGAVNV